MDRYVLYTNKVSNKILSSKMLYYSKKNILTIPRLILAANANPATQDVSAAVMTLVFAKRPAFFQKRNPRTKTYINTDVILTLRKRHIYKNLNLLVQTLSLSQLENNMSTLTSSYKNQLSWTMRTCRPPEQFKAFFDKYPLNTDDFSMSLHAKLSSTNINELVFKLRLLQMPVQEYSVEVID